MSKTVEEVRQAQRAEGPATVLAIGTATPSNLVYQADYPDYYFRITNSEHLTDLKEKFKRMCKFHCSCSSSIKKEQKMRRMHVLPPKLALLMEWSYLGLDYDGLKDCVFCRRQVDDPEAVHALERGDPQG